MSSATRPLSVSALAKLALLAAALLMPLSGCHLLQRRIYAQWQTAEVESATHRAMFEACAMALTDAQFPVGPDVDPARGEFETGWFTSPAPFKGRGYRERARLEYESAGEGKFSVRVRVLRETNESFRPLEPEHSKWEPSEDNPEAARRVIQFLESRLLTSRA